MPYWPKDDPDVPQDLQRARRYPFAYADGEDRRHGPTEHQAHGDDDDETANAAMGFIDKQVKGGKAVLRLDEFHADAHLTHIRPEYHGKSGMPGNDYADGMWEHDQDVGKLAEAARRSGNREGHDRDLHHRQRPEHVQLARCSDDSIP